MPRSRNRGIASNFEFPPDFLKTLPPPEKIESLEKSPLLPSYINFEEPVTYKKYGYGKIGDLSSSSECDNFSDFDIVSFGRSSASSVSWNEDFDAEGTRQVKNELERLDRILCGKESIPSNYNRDEYELWMNTFPQLRVFENIEEIPLLKGEHLEICDNNFTSHCKKQTNSINFTVIDDAIQDVFSKEPYCRDNQEHCSKHTGETHTGKLNKRFDNVLRISPVLLQEPVNRSFYLDTRQPSYSVYKSAKSASKWMREEPQDYTLLPYLKITESAKLKSKKNMNNKTTNSSKFKGMSPKKNSVSLPPIKTITMPSSAQYRSVSATLHKVSNEQSAVSAHIDSLKRRRKVEQHKLESIQSIFNYPH